MYYGKNTRLIGRKTSEATNLNSTHFCSDDSVLSVLVLVDVDLSVSEAVVYPSFLLFLLSIAERTSFFNFIYFSFNAIYLSCSSRFSQRIFSNSMLSWWIALPVCFLASFSTSREKSARISSKCCLYILRVRSSWNRNSEFFPVTCNRKYVM